MNILAEIRKRLEAVMPLNEPLTIMQVHTPLEAQDLRFSRVDVREILIRCKDEGSVEYQNRGGAGRAFWVRTGPIAQDPERKQREGVTVTWKRFDQPGGSPRIKPITLPAFPGALEERA